MHWNPWHIFGNADSGILNFVPMCSNRPSPLGDSVWQLGSYKHHMCIELIIVFQGVLKSFLTEITDDTNRGHGFSWLSVGWSAGAIIGPLLGGLLCYPAQKYHTLFSSGGIFSTHSFLLPCLVCVGCDIGTGLYCIMCMKESNGGACKPSGGGHETSRGNYVPLEKDENPNSDHEGCEMVIKTDNESIDIIGSGGDILMSDCQVSLHKDKEDPGTKAETNSKTSTTLPPIADTSVVSETSNRALNREVVLSVMAYGFCCMSFIIIDETAPLMMKLDRTQGGLSFSSSRIGSILAVGGVAMLAWTTLFMPLISSRSKLWLFRCAFLVSVPMTLFFPVIATCSGYILRHLGQELGTQAISALFVVALTIRGCTSTVMFLSVSVHHNFSIQVYSL